MKGITTKRILMMGTLHHSIHNGSLTKLGGFHHHYFILRKNIYLFADSLWVLRLDRLNSRSPYGRQ